MSFPVPRGYRTSRNMDQALVRRFSRFAPASRASIGVLR